MLPLKWHTINNRVGKNRNPIHTKKTLKTRIWAHLCILELSLIYTYNQVLPHVGN